MQVPRFRVRVTYIMLNRCVANIQPGVAGWLAGWLRGPGQQAGGPPVLWRGGAQLFWPAPAPNLPRLYFPNVTPLAQVTPSPEKPL